MSESKNDSQPLPSWKYLVKVIFQKILQNKLLMFIDLFTWDSNNAKKNY